MRQIIKKFRDSKVAKILFYIFSCLCGVVIIGYLYLFIYYPYAYFPMKKPYTIMYLNSLVEKILNIPYMDDSEEHQNNVGDLEHISYKEWFKMECEHPKTETDNYYVSFKAKQMNLHHEDLKLLHCLVPVFWGDKYPYPNKMPRHCTNIFNCSSINLTMYDYVLQYPKVLNNLIKIMEKPCLYIKELVNIDKNKMDKKKLQTSLDINNKVRRIRDELYCDKTKDNFYEKDRTYSVIYILDKDGNRKTEILVPRKDNAHLVQ